MGALLIREAVGSASSRAARIVEVEAYIGEADQASHARFGRTARNGVMYGAPGRAYVYLVYGMHECLNVVTEPEGRPAAVLVRAVEPLDAASAAAMRDARGRAWAAQRSRRGAPSPDAVARERARLARIPDARLASGPGLVTAAFDITRADTGADLLAPDALLRLISGPAPERVVTTPRIGIGYAAEPWRSKPWRFLDPDSPSVSGPRGSGRRRAGQRAARATS